MHSFDDLDAGPLMADPWMRAFRSTLGPKGEA